MKHVTVHGRLPTARHYIPLGAWLVGEIMGVTMFKLYLTCGQKTFLLKIHTGLKGAATRLQRTVAN
jgi:hypothetical protein